MGRVLTRAWWSVVVTAGVLLSAGVASGGGPAAFMMSARVDGQQLEGQPLAWTDSQMLLLGRDGALYDFDPKVAQGAKKSGPAFRGYSTSEMRTRLSEEFGSGFQISTTQHFVVVHPPGQWRAWTERLELLYRSFTHSMQVRGFAVRQPPVPLVAVVFSSQRDYYRYAAASGTSLQPGTLGHYSPQSNRIFLFDASGGSANADWSANAGTIIHEATHQTAYNVGVHRRFAVQPRWLVEGLAMMFEARGVWDGRSIHTQSDRIHRSRLNDFRSRLPERRPDALVRLIATDQPFQTEPLAAYAEAWALTFFLCETRPQQYSEFLARVASRKPFTDYRAQERVADFAEFFGTDFEMLDAEYTRFTSGLK